MPKCTIDGREVEFNLGENLVTVAKRANVEIPVFCYHPGLSVVAQCRMCLVEVEKMPKLQTACSTNAAEGMVVKTQTDPVVKARAGTMEFLLLNHPLDCPVCDKAGECDLQDNSFGYGNAKMRGSEERRTYVDVDMGPVIQKNMNRCIHCTRCIRFGDEIAGIHEMVAIKRGNNTDITTIDGKQLQTEYAGNYSDICPTGSLTLKDFRFKKRAWMLKKTNSVCDGCSKGCNIEVQHEGNVIYRVIPRENLEINKFWMCDEGRFLYHHTQNEARITSPQFRNGSNLEKISWKDAIAATRDEIENQKLLFLVGTDLTLEELETVQKYVNLNHPNSVIQHFGTKNIFKSENDMPADTILKMKSKTSNLKGAEKLGIKPLEAEVAVNDTIVVVSGGRASLPALKAKRVVAIGSFLEKETNAIDILLPTLTSFEKDGTIINHQGVEQKLKKVIVPKSELKAVSEILMLLTYSKVALGVST